jgi:hypothetical protein
MPHSLVAPGKQGPADLLSVLLLGPLIIDESALAHFSFAWELCVRSFEVLLSVT